MVRAVVEAVTVVSEYILTTVAGSLELRAPILRTQTVRSCCWVGFGRGWTAGC